MSSTKLSSLIETSSDGIISSVSKAAEARATMASIGVSVLAVMLKAMSRKFGVSALNDYIFIQMILGNLLGFLADQGYASKEGFSLFKKADGLVTTVKDGDLDVVKWNIDKFTYNPSADNFTLNPGVTKESLGNPISHFNYMFKRVGSSQFIRFMITVIIDVIISTVIYSVLRNHLREKGQYHECKSNLKTDLAIQFFIGLTTFYIYVNIMRIGWAYQDKPDDKVTLSVAAIGVASALAYLALGENEKSDYFEKKNGKLKLVLLLLTLLFINKVISDSASLTKSLGAGNTSLGLGLAAIITLGSLYYAKNLKLGKKRTIVKKRKAKIPMKNQMKTLAQRKIQTMNPMKTATPR